MASLPVEALIWNRRGASLTFRRAGVSIPLQKA
jgi:hypothetical protein